MNELAPVCEYLTLSWIKQLEVRQMARYVMHTEAKRKGYPHVAVAYELMPDVSEIFVFSVVNKHICMFVPAVLFYSLKHATKEFVYDKGSLYIIFHVGKGDGLVRVLVHPKIINSFEINGMNDGRVFVCGYYKPGNDFVIEDSSALGFDDLASSLFEEDSAVEVVEGEDGVFDVIDDHFVVSLIAKE